MTATLSPAERAYIISGLATSPPTRSDGRGLLGPREIETEYGVMPAANGSARVRIGGTEVVAGIKLDVGEVASGGYESGNEWRTKVEVDITPQAFPMAKDTALSTLSAQFSAMLTEHFVPCVPALRITDTRAFVPTLHVALLSADGGVAAALVLAARAAFADLEVPRTKVVGWEGDSGDIENPADLAGIKGAIAARRGGKGKGRAGARAGGDDWELEGDVEPLPDRETLPVLVTLNLVPGDDHNDVFVDATPQEEAACPERIHVFVRPSGRIAGVRMEGDDGVDAARIKPLLEEARRIALELAEALNADLP